MLLGLNLNTFYSPRTIGYLVNCITRLPAWVVCRYLNWLTLMNLAVLTAYNELRRISPGFRHEPLFKYSSQRRSRWNPYDSFKLQQDAFFTLSGTSNATCQSDKKPWTYYLWQKSAYGQQMTETKTWPVLAHFESLKQSSSHKQMPLIGHQHQPSDLLDKHSLYDQTAVIELRILSYICPLQRYIISSYIPYWSTILLSTLIQSVIISYRPITLISKTFWYLRSFALQWLYYHRCPYIMCVCVSGGLVFTYLFRHTSYIVR